MKREKVNSKAIKKWLIDKEITQMDIARDLGVSGPLVYRAINGWIRTKRVLDWLRKHGCPERYLEPPQKKAA